MHHIDRGTPFDEIWEAFSVLRQQGKDPANDFMARHQMLLDNTEAAS